MVIKRIFFISSLLCLYTLTYTLGAENILIQAVKFTSNTVIDAGDTAYDGQEVIIDGCTLTFSF